MRLANRTTYLFLLSIVLAPLDARTRKGDKLLAQGHMAEQRGELDKALGFDESALSEDPSDPAYQLEVRRVRFNSAAMHIKNGQKIRSEGRLAEALAEFERAYRTDPSSGIAEQEIRRTKTMIEREKRKQSGQAALPSEDEVELAAKTLTPAEQSRKDSNERIDRIQGVPELRPLTPQPLTIRMTNKPRVLFETVGKLAGINVLFDPEYEQQNQTKPPAIDLTNATLEQALDYLSLVTKSFWKPLSNNAIFVTLDNTTKRREFEEQVVKVFYLTNVTTTTELQEVITTLRTVADIQKVYQYASLSALIVRCEADRMLLAEKIIADLDKARSEVVVDVVVMEVRRDLTRTLAAQLAPGGLNSSIAFTPRSSLQAPTASTPSTTTSAVATTTTTPTTSNNSSILLPNIKKLSTGDFSITNVPGALIEALMSDSGTRVLQSPQLRAVDNQKASLHIGDKVPTASGSLGSGIGGVGVGVSPLVQTQFTYIETGVNMDMNPKVNDANEVSMHIEIDISQVTGYRDVGGIQQPIISQRKVAQDVRMHDGSINLLGGLIQEQDAKTISGIPGLAQLPVFGRLFKSEVVTKSNTELLITLIPHIVRAPDVSESNLRGIASGNITNVKLQQSPRPAPADTSRTAAQPGAPAPAVVPAVPPAATTPAPSPAASPAGAPAVSFSPAQAEMLLGAALMVTMRVDNITDLNSAMAQLKYDPKVLLVNDVVAGDLVQQTGPALVPSKNIMNDTGSATVSVARGPGTPGVSGSGGLFTITFQAVGRGTTTVSLQQLMLKNAGGQPVPTNTPSLAVNVK